MTHPTTAGVLASFASLGDVTVAEPGALLSFTGPRVVQQTVREKLPDDFGLTESNFRLGHLDAILSRSELRPFLGRAARSLRRWTAKPASERPVRALEQLRLRERLAKLGDLPLLRGARVQGELGRLRRQIERIAQEPTEDEVWRAVQLARHQDRPYTLDYVERIFDDFVELHGDRCNLDDHALVAGLGRFGGRTVALVGHQKGRDIHERTRRNFGMALPEGYRKAIRVMELADRHRFPVLTLIDTPGAYPGVAAEQHGQGGVDRPFAARDVPPLAFPPWRA